MHHFFRSWTNQTRVGWLLVLCCLLGLTTPASAFAMDDAANAAAEQEMPLAQTDDGKIYLPYVMNNSVPTDIDHPTVNVTEPTFALGHRFAGIAGNPSSVVTGDLDGDGDLDVVVGYNGARLGAPRIGWENRIYMNDGAGGFDQGTNLPMVDSTAAVALGDLNGDGALDIVVGNNGADHGAIEADLLYFNDGHGNFAEPVPLDAPLNTNSVTLADLNGDGALDIIMVGDSTTPARIYFNDGLGMFDSPSSLLLGDNLTVEGLAVGDFDDDGALDIAIVATEKQAIYLNNGQGAFDERTPIELRATKSDRYWRSKVTIGDLDLDGDLDLFVHEGPFAAIYFNNGAGQWAAGEFPGRYVDISNIELGDLNGDGALDLVVVGLFDVEIGLSEAFVYLNNGHGQYNKNGSISVANYASSVANALADIDGNGTLDIINTDAVILNGSSTFFARTLTFKAQSPDDSKFLLGDINNDTQLDIISPNGIFINNDQDFVREGAFESNTNVWLEAVGDLDGDNALDIVSTPLDGEHRLNIHFNEGQGSTFHQAALEGTFLAMGDIDSDGLLDIIVYLAVDNYYKIGIYLNQGGRNFGRAHLIGHYYNLYDFNAEKFALGDLDSDGDLDMFLGGGFGSPGPSLEAPELLINDGQADFKAIDFGDTLYPPDSVALGDLDGNGFLDAVMVYNHGPHALYFSDDQGDFHESTTLGSGLNRARHVALGDLNGDGALDIITNDGASGRVETTPLLHTLFLNDGNGGFQQSLQLGEANDQTWSAVGDLNNDGALDAIFLSDGEMHLVDFNQGKRAPTLTNSAPYLTISRPGKTGAAPFFSVSNILAETQIRVPYTLFDAEGDTVGRVALFYSLNGGGDWQPAVATPDTVTAHLAASPIGVSHSFTWDTFASGLFGLADNVVLRMVAYPQPAQPATAGTYHYPHRTAGPYQWSTTSATTFPFRVRGSQVRVYQDSVAAGQEAVGAVVYRLSPLGDAEPLSDGNGRPFVTDGNGYLQGQGRIEPGDQLVALQPVNPLATVPFSLTERYSDTLHLFNTNATPTAAGLQSYMITEAGVQTLTVSVNNPLLLFDLDVSLEWDARNDAQFQTQLAFDLKRASAHLYDWSNGQVALGKITIYQAKARWDDAHIRIYASNRLRPSAVRGGVVEVVVHDPDNEKIRYFPGQIRMGATWNRFGDAAAGNQAEDWARTLAHELGHYLLFLEDNYLGIDDAGLIVQISDCPGVMTDPYREDDFYSEFHPEMAWPQECGQTLAQHETGRADWQSIQKFYPWLNSPHNATEINPGPSTLPLAVTQVTFAPISAPTATLDVPIFYTTRADRQYQPGRSARAYLFQDDTLLDLGRPVVNRVEARGARPGDRLCLFEPAQHLAGCETIAAGDELLALSENLNWTPELLVSPVTSRTIQVAISSAITDLTLYALLYPAEGPTPPAIALRFDNGRYTGTFHLGHEAMEGYIHIWAEGVDPIHEIVTDFVTGGNPGLIRSHGLRRNNAPVLSGDGQVILFGEGLTFGTDEFYALQSATAIPAAPVWATVVGEAYHLLLSEKAPVLAGTSLSFAYLGREVPLGQEAWLRIYHWDEVEQAWQPLPTTVNGAQNLAVAPISEAGLYALMTSTEISLTQGWNLIAYPIQESRPITAALASIEGQYTRVCGYEIDQGGTTPVWLVYEPGPTGRKALRELHFGHGYWIDMVQPAILRFKAATDPAVVAAAEGKLDTNAVLPDPCGP